MRHSEATEDLSWRHETDPEAIALFPDITGSDHKIVYFLLTGNYIIGYKLYEKNNSSLHFMEEWDVLW